MQQLQVHMIIFIIATYKNLQSFGSLSQQILKQPSNLDSKKLYSFCISSHTRIQKDLFFNFPP